MKRSVKKVKYREESDIRWQISMDSVFLVGETKGLLQQEPRPPALHADATNSVPHCRCRADSVIMEKSGSRSRPLWEFQLTVRPRTKPATSHRAAG